MTPAHLTDDPTLPVTQAAAHLADGWNLRPMAWWSDAAPEGWRTHGVEGRPLPAESPEGHPSYAAVLACIGEAAT